VYQQPWTFGLWIKQRHLSSASPCIGSILTVCPQSGLYKLKSLHSGGFWDRTLETMPGVILWGFASRLGSFLWEPARLDQDFFCVEFDLTNMQQLYCITADNASNNNTTCETVERLLHARRIYSFDPFTCCLFCLAHVVNLGVTNLMAAITKTATVETTSAIWEYDPMLPDNRVLGDSLDVIAAVRTLAIKVCLSFLWLPCWSIIKFTYQIDSVLRPADPIFQNTSRKVWNWSSMHDTTA